MLHFFTLAVRNPRIMLGPAEARYLDKKLTTTAQSKRNEPFDRVRVWTPMRGLDFSRISLEGVADAGKIWSEVVYIQLSQRLHTMWK